MKIVSELGNTKADKATKLHNLHGANGRHVRHNGISYFMKVVQVGSLTIASAYLPRLGQPPVNLFGDDTLAKELKKLCENRLYS
jgi:hypothetical protein